MPPCPQSPARERHGDAQAVVLVTAATASPPSLPPWLLAALPAWEWLAAQGGPTEVGASPRQAWQAGPPTPLRRSSVPLLPHLDFGCSEGRTQSSWPSGDVSFRTPLCCQGSAQRGCRVFPSPLHSPAPSPVPKGPLPGPHGRWTLPSARRGGCFRGCHRPAGVPRFPERV